MNSLMFLIAYLNASHDRVTPRVVIRTPRNVTIGPVNNWTVSRIGIHGAKRPTHQAPILQRRRLLRLLRSLADDNTRGERTGRSATAHRANLLRRTWSIRPHLRCGQGNARANHGSLDAFHSSLHRTQALETAFPLCLESGMLGRHSFPPKTSAKDNHRPSS